MIRLQPNTEISVILFAIQEGTRLQRISSTTAQHTAQLSGVCQGNLHPFYVWIPYDACRAVWCPSSHQTAAWRMMYNRWGSSNRKEPAGNRKKQKTLFRKTDLFFSNEKKNNVMEIHNEKLMHIEETEMWKYTLWIYKYRLWKWGARLS